MHLIFGPTVGQRENIKAGMSSAHSVERLITAQPCRFTCWQIWRTCVHAHTSNRQSCRLTGRSLYLPSLVKTVVALTSCSEHCQGCCFCSYRCLLCCCATEIVRLLYTIKLINFFRTLKKFPVQQQAAKKKRLSGSVDSRCTASGRSSEFLFRKTCHPFGSPFFIPEPPVPVPLNLTSWSSEACLIQMSLDQVGMGLLTFLHSSAPADWVTRHLLYTATCNFNQSSATSSDKGIDSNGNETGVTSCAFRSLPFVTILNQRVSSGQETL